MPDIRRAKETTDPDLVEAQTDLSEVFQEAREDGLPRPARATVEAADRLLREMFQLSPRPYSVYPTPDREIAIHGQHVNSGSVLVLCDSEGGALCLVSLLRTSRRARYSDVDDLPDGFLTQALHDLDRLAGIGRGSRCLTETTSSRALTQPAPRAPTRAPTKVPA